MATNNDFESIDYMEYSASITRHMGNTAHMEDTSYDNDSLVLYPDQGEIQAIRDNLQTPTCDGPDLMLNPNHTLLSDFTYQMYSPRNKADDTASIELARKMQADEDALSALQLLSDVNPPDPNEGLSRLSPHHHHAQNLNMLADIQDPENDVTDNMHIHIPNGMDSILILQAEEDEWSAQQLQLGIELCDPEQGSSPGSPQENRLNIGDKPSDPEEGPSHTSQTHHWANINMWAEIQDPENDVTEHMHIPDGMDSILILQAEEDEWSAQQLQLGVEACDPEPGPSHGSPLVNRLNISFNPSDPEEGPSQTSQTHHSQECTSLEQDTMRVNTNHSSMHEVHQYRKSILAFFEEGAYSTEQLACALKDGSYKELGQHATAACEKFRDGALVAELTAEQIDLLLEVAADYKEQISCDLEERRLQIVSLIDDVSETNDLEREHDECDKLKAEMAEANIEFIRVANEYLTEGDKRDESWSVFRYTRYIPFVNAIHGIVHWAIKDRHENMHVQLKDKEDNINNLDQRFEKRLKVLNQKNDEWIGKIMQCISLASGTDELVELVDMIQSNQHHLATVSGVLQAALPPLTKAAIESQTLQQNVPAAVASRLPSAQRRNQRRMDDFATKVEEFLGKLHVHQDHIFINE